MRTSGVDSSLDTAGLRWSECCARVTAGVVDGGYPETDFLLPAGEGIDHVLTGGGPFGVDGAETVVRCGT